MFSPHRKSIRLNVTLPARENWTLSFAVVNLPFAMWMKWTTNGRRQATHKIHIGIFLRFVLDYDGRTSWNTTCVPYTHSTLTQTPLRTAYMHRYTLTQTHTIALLTTADIIECVGVGVFIAITVSHVVSFIHPYSCSLCQSVSQSQSVGFSQFMWVNALDAIVQLSKQITFTITYTLHTQVYIQTRREIRLSQLQLQKRNRKKNK